MPFRVLAPMFPPSLPVLYTPVTGASFYLMSVEFLLPDDWRYNSPLSISLGWHHCHDLIIPHLEYKLPITTTPQPDIAKQVGIGWINLNRHKTMWAGYSYHIHIVTQAVVSSILVMARSQYR